MKNIIEKYGLITSLVAIFLIVFVFGGMFSRYMTTQKKLHAQEQSAGAYLAMFDNATRADEFKPTAVVKSYLKPLSTTDSFSPELVSSYKIYNGDTEIGVVYVVKSFGKYSDLVVAYAISLTNNSIIGVTVVSNKETDSPEYYGKLKTSGFFNQFSNKSLEDFGFAVDTVAGATMSTKGIEIGMFYAREQYAQDYNFVIPSIVMTLNSLTYNLDPATFATKPYIADVTYGDDNTNVVVYLDSSFNHAGTITGTEPANDAKAAIKSYASGSGLVVTSASFVSYDENTRSLVVISKGYNQTAIQGTYVLNAALDGVESYTFVTNETYANEYNEGYNHSLGEAPYVENNLSNQFKNGEVEIDGVAGATVTSDAMKNMINLVKLFIADQNGGN